MDGKKLQVTLEIVTPLFLGGANPRGEPELRAASFRGVLRFWLRALLGGVLGDNPQQIFKQESKVFGSTEHASPVIVKVEHPDKLEPGNFDPLPHKMEGKGFTFKGFKPGQRFTLTLLSRDENALSQATKALHLLCLLGGLGRRSRRGFGSLQIVKGDLPLLGAQSIDDLSSKLRARLTDILGNKFASLPADHVPSFPILHPKWAQVKVCSTEFRDSQQSRGWNEAIKFVMGKAHEHKDPVLGWAEKGERQASPVHVHLVKLVNGKYALVLTTLLSELNQNLRSRANRNKLADFLNAFKGKVVFGFEEVPENWLGGNER